jgi:ABC-type multidrug transport system fused ATPase/permease subunit
MTDLGLKVMSSQYSKYINLPFWLFQKLGTGQVMNDVMGVPYMFIGGVLRPLFAILSEAIMVLIITVIFLLYQPILLLILTVVLVPSTFLTYRALRNRSQYIGYRMDALRPKANSLLLDAFAGFVELKLANKQADFKERTLANQRETQYLDAQAFLYTLIPTKVIEMVAVLALVTIFLYALLFTESAGSLVAIIGAFATAAYRLMPSVNRIISSLVSLKQYVFALDVLGKYREYEQPLQLPQNRSVTFLHTVSFDHLTFSFPETEQPVLQDISFSVRKGEKVGFIGSSGSGKTTLMNVLLRFHQEQQGHVRVDDEALTPAHIVAWHQIIGYVKQDTFLMDGSIQDNITLGETSVNEQRLRFAIEQASLNEFVNSLPDGVNTHIGERGSRLSGGQRQRIGIARALYKQTQVLLMDEATSALDNETEREVNEAIRKLAQTDITILIIAHRITTLRDCDKIYELKDGRIIAVHQYEELIQKVI